jgi:hypothetical protein
MSSSRWCRPLPPRWLAAAIAGAVLLLVGCFLATYRHGDNPSLPDVARYDRYGNDAANGRIPYRDFRLEYPPAALAAFVLPVYGGRAFGSVDKAAWSPRANAPASRYAHAFAALMIFLAAIALILTAVSLSALYASSRHTLAALGLIAASPLFLGGVVYTRYDFWPAALCAAALAALLHGRTRLAAIALGVAIAAKFYPLVLLPLVITHVWKHEGRAEALRALALTATTSFAIFLPLLALAPGQVWFAVRDQLGRGLQVESLGSAVLALLDRLGLLRDYVRQAGNGLSADELRGQGVTPELIVGLLVLAAVLALLWFRFARRGRDNHDLVRYSAAVLVALLALGHVLSPQFLIWLLPIVPLIGSRRGLLASAVFGLTLVVTHVWFTTYYVPFVAHLSEGPTLLLLSRDFLLLFVLAALIWPAQSLPALSRARRHRLRGALSR